MKKLAARHLAQPAKVAALFRFQPACNQLNDVS